MEPPQAQADLGPRETFYRNFQHGVADLQERMERLSHMSAGSERNETIDDCLAGIDRLSHEVKDSSSYLPAYDQRTHSEAIKALAEKLQNIRNAFNPPKKFSFKSRKTAPTIRRDDLNGSASSESASVTGPTFNSSNANVPRTSSNPSQAHQSTALDNTEEVIDDGIAVGTGVRRPSFSKSSKITISKHEGLHIILPASASHATSSGTISNIRRCVVDLSRPSTDGSPFSALYVKSIKDSLIICGQVAGAIHITDVENSVLVTSCQQFRMHGSRSVDVYLHSASRPIFEDCTGLRFAPLPERFVTQAIAQTSNQWDQIDDFKWLKAEPSPHFSILGESQRVGDDVWKSRVQGEDGVGLDDILKAVGVR